MEMMGYFSASRLSSKRREVHLFTESEAGKARRREPRKKPLDDTGFSLDFENGYINQSFRFMPLFYADL
jgi:hypothetical protein